MKNTWKKHKFLLWTALYVVLVVVVVFYFLIVPLIGEIKYKSDEIQRKNIDIDINQKRTADIPKIEGQLRSFSEKEKELDVILGSDGSVGFIEELETLAENTGNSISLKIEDEKKEKAAKKPVDDKRVSIKDSLPYENYMLLKISLEGGYDEFLNFINKLENMGHYANIISINISALEAVPEIYSGRIFADRSKKEEESKKMTGGKTIKSDIEIAVYIKK